MATDANVAERAVVGLSRESQRMHAARQQLGMRAEQTIQREIRQTEAAYNRLLRTGQLTASEQARAFQAMRDKVAGLRRELQGVADQESRLGKGWPWRGRYRWWRGSSGLCAEPARWSASKTTTCTCAI